VEVELLQCQPKSVIGLLPKKARLDAVFGGCTEATRVKILAVNCQEVYNPGRNRRQVS